MGAEPPGPALTPPGRARLGKRPVRSSGEPPCASVSRMDPHRLAEARSLAYHRAIAQRLREEPELLDAARRRVQGWLVAGSPSPAVAARWADLLAGDTPAVAAFLGETSELAVELRQSSPFAGALSPRERWRIWRATRDQLSSAP